MAKLRNVDRGVLRLWDESKHPRDNRGRFATKSSSGIKWESAKDLKGAEKIATDLGFNVDYGKDERMLPLANYISTGLKDMVRQGVKPPDSKIVIARESGFKNPLALLMTRGLSARYDDKRKMLHFNHKSPHFDPIKYPTAEAIGESFRTNIADEHKGVPYMVKDSPLGFVYHEVGHIKHSDHTPKAYEDELLDEAIPKSMYPKVKAHLSDYALFDALEYVAEMYSGMLQGNTYDKEMMDLYKKYKGPPLKG